MTKVVVIGGSPGRSVNVGTIGHVNVGKAVLSRALTGTSRGNKSDRKRNRKDRWR